MKIQRSTAFPLVALAFLVAGTSCSFSPGYSSVLTGEGTNEMCFVVVPPSEGQVVIGEVVTNNGSQPVTVTDVMLLDAQDIVVEDASIVPMKPGPGTALGVGSTLTRDTEVRALLELAEPAEGYVIAPGEQVNVVVAVSLPSGVQQGTAAGFDVRYEDGPGIDVTDSRIKLTMAAGSCP